MLKEKWVRKLTKYNIAHSGKSIAEMQALFEAHRSKPKRPATSFILFSKEHRKQVIRDHPGYSFGQIASAVSQHWNGMSAAQRKPYITAADRAIASYKREVEKHQPPKKPLSAYLFFSLDNRSRISRRSASPNMPNFESVAARRRWMSEHSGFAAIGRALGAQWRALSAAEKAPYERRAEADRSRYASELSAYLAKHGPIVRRSPGHRLRSATAAKSTGRSRAASPKRRTRKAATKSRSRSRSRSPSRRASK